MNSARQSATTAAQDEVERFAAQADDWWDETGIFGQLHKINPARITFIRDHLCAHFGRDPMAIDSLKGLTIVDIGCGGGLLTEPMARLGAEVTGLDAAAEGIVAAAAHAREMGLSIDYQTALPEDLAATGRTFDVVLNMEVVEHVADPAAFFAAAGALVRPGGAMVVATLNRTIKSLALAKIGAEYLLRWVPPGTHDWRKFVKPSELARHLRREGFSVVDLKGLVYHPAADEWSLGDDVDVNYLMVAVKD